MAMTAKVTLAFDVYGTLIDTEGVLRVLEELVGSSAAEFSRLWRDKQLEYSFRRALMQNYVPFPRCTREALDFTCSALAQPLTAENKQRLMDAYKTLPAFEDVAGGLEAARHEGFRLFAFSNGPAEALELLLKSAGIRSYFQDVVSTDEIKSFKPNPAVYCHFLRRAAALGSEAWMISGNSFDALGALSAGMRAVWVRRNSANIFDPWEFSPTITVSSLTALAGEIACFEAGGETQAQKPSAGE